MPLLKDLSALFFVDSLLFLEPELQGFDLGQEDVVMLLFQDSRGVVTRNWLRHKNPRRLRHLGVGPFTTAAGSVVHFIQKMGSLG